jgi:23S rRNA (cytidine1920-2'-O)/16S rRNA (cytidine1409-2'-O)-methyltransferase
LKETAAPRRLDLLLVERYPDLSRSRVQGEIMAGRVRVNGRVCDKPGSLVSPDAQVELSTPDNPYTGRGGLKLEGALEDLNLDVQDLVVLDAGASTGGFTDCLLQKGARRVYAIDVGYGQLAWTLRQDPRVTVMERFNIRNLKPEHLPEAPHLAVSDVSFISLKLVIPVLRAAGVPALLALIKPQFEAGRAQADKGRGVIRDPGAHRAVLLDLIEFACRAGYCCSGLTFSRRPGPRGNLEFFAHWIDARGGPCLCPAEPAGLIQTVVEQAHRILQ